MIEIRCESNLALAKELWEALSPKESIYDLWDFRFCFYQHKPLPLCFYTAYEDGRPVALLPLQDNQEQGYLEFMADDLMESNRIFSRPGYGHLGADLIKALDKSLRLFDVVFDEAFQPDWPLEDYTYYYDLSALETFNDYLKSAFTDRRRRHNFKRVFSLLEEKRQLEVVYDDFADLNFLMDLNANQFGGESYLSQPQDRQPFHDLIKLPLDFKFITLKVDGEKTACSLAIIYRDTYYYLIAGANRNQEPDAFKYLTRLNIELALSKKVKIFSTGIGDCGWKPFWHFSQYPQYKLSIDR